jgi:tetratricopeptide (TPR) repeat protein
MRRLSLSSFTVLLLILSAHAQKVNSAKDHFEKAFAYLAEQKYDQAVSELDQAIQMDGRFAEAYGLRGSIRFLRQELELALADFDKVVELAPNITGIHQVYNNRSVIKLIKGDRAGALIDANKAIAISPGFAEAYNTRGFLRLDAGDMDGALADFDKSISLNPAASRPYEGRGIIRSFRGDLSGALDDYNKAVELNPNHPAPYIDRALLHYQKGELDAALADYDKVIKLSPTNAKANLNRGVIHILKGQVNEGLADLRTGFEIDPLAFDSNRKPSFVNSAVLLDQFITSNPRNPRGYQARGIVRLMQGKEKVAEPDFQKALSLDPNLKTEIDTLKNKLRR